MVKILFLIFSFSPLWNNVSGLFLDSMLDKCHGLPFCEQLQPAFDNGQRDTQNRLTSVNTLSAHSGRTQDALSRQRLPGNEASGGRQSQRPVNYDNMLNSRQPQRRVGSNTLNGHRVSSNNYVTVYGNHGHMTSSQNNGRQVPRPSQYNGQDRTMQTFTLSKQQLLELLMRLDSQRNSHSSLDRPQQHAQPGRSYVMDKYNSNGHQQQLQSQDQISQLLGRNTDRGQASSPPTEGASSPYSVVGNQGGRMDPRASSRSPFQMMSGNSGQGQGPGGPFTTGGSPVSPYSTAGGSGGTSQMSPFSTAQREHTINTPGQMFSSVMNPGKMMPLGPAAGMGNHGGQMANNFFGSQNKEQTDASVVFGDTDEVQYVNGKIVIPKSWALNHLAKAIQQQEQLQGKGPGEGSFGCPEFSSKCPKKYTFLDNNGCPICSYIPQEVKSTEPPKSVSRPDICDKPPESTGPCGTFEQRYAFDKRVKRCRVYVQNACGDLQNKFGTIEECQYVCGRQTEDKKTTWYDKIWSK